jgi:hypothetical protein
MKIHNRGCSKFSAGGAITGFSGPAFAFILAVGFALPVRAQYTAPAPPAPFAGFLNEWLRAADTNMNKWDLGGSARFRYEIKDGFAIPGQPGSVDFRDHGADVDNEYFLGKVRFHAGYSESWWSAYAEGRSSFAFSDQRFAYANSPAIPGTVARRGAGPESDTIDLQQAFVTVGNQKELPVSLKVGRQELSYGEERLVGAFAWNNIGRVFDAAKLRWQNDLFGVDFFVSRPVIPEDERVNVENDYDWFSGMYATTALLPKNILDLYFFSRNSSSKAPAAEPSPQFPQPSARDIYTVGGRLKSKPGELGNWDYLLDGAYQFGDFRDQRFGANSPRLTQDAYMFVAEAGYTFTDVWGKPRLGLEYDFASGDSSTNDNKHQTFDNLFPTNHKFYGYMDFISLQNIHDVRGIFQLNPISRLSLAVEGHGFWLADTHDSFYNVAGVPRGGIAATPAGTGYGINPNYSNFVGTELDAIAGLAVTRFAQLEVGYGHFFTGDYIRESLHAATVGSREADYVYIQATIGF